MPGSPAARDPRFVTEGIVEGFEMVQIEHYDTEQLIHSRCPSYLPLQAFIEIAPIEKTS
jgi:hypothetical protein